jgi:hypothetical protein
VRYQPHVRSSRDEGSRATEHGQRSSRERARATQAFAQSIERHRGYRGPPSALEVQLLRRQYSTYEPRNGRDNFHISRYNKARTEDYEKVRNMTRSRGSWRNCKPPPGYEVGGSTLTRQTGVSVLHLIDDVSLAPH